MTDANATELLRTIVQAIEDNRRGDRGVYAELVFDALPIGWLVEAKRATGWVRPKIEESGND